MKNVALGCLLSALVALVATPAAAQLKLPAASPAAKVMQEVGVTEISIEYSSPGVKGRKVWGDLVPFDKAWRTGANAASKITFSRDVTFGGKPVPAGTYTIVTLPSQKGWKMMLNKDLTIWAGLKPYDPAQDLVTVDATTTEIPLRERLAFLFSNTTDDATSLDMEWEKLRVSVPIKVDTAAHVQAGMQTAVVSSSRMLANMARHVAESTKDYAAALKHADASVAIQSTWYNQWIRADILARMGKYAEARKAAQASWDLGQNDKGFFFRDQVSKALAEWKGKK
ncbi:DUF2911 domain-containing protein [Myxococcus sp. RHST-1-4]|nr:DUF2911 domain-containing protein [Myxococcus sp. RHSTA-1-4]MBZ4418431.1 DUF2911 domain-containing protein [Myxococcus sp. RHSTA-1-4]